MKWSRLIELVGNQPVFTTGFLAGGTDRQEALRLQLTRWRQAGKLIQLRRGVYCLADPFSKVRPEPFLLANALKSASYVSLQSALAYHGMIPESVPVVTSITTGRPETLDTPLGQFYYRHVKTNWFFGYRQTELSGGQVAFIAQPEKALLDLAYLTPDAREYPYWQEMRLQQLENLDLEQLRQWVETRGGEKLRRAVRHIARLHEDASGETL